MALLTTISTVLQALLPLFALILLGFLLRRFSGVLHLGHLPSFTGLVVNVTLPATVILAITRAQDIPAQYARLPIALILAEIVTLAIAYAGGRALRLPHPTIGMLMMCACFGNTIFLGYPIAKSLVPNEFLAAVVIDQFGCIFPLMLTAGVLGGLFGDSRPVPPPNAMDPDSSEGEAPAAPTGASSAAGIGLALLRWARSPIFLAILIAFALRCLPWPAALRHAHSAVILGAMVVKILEYLSPATTPLALLSLGAALQPRAAAASSRLLLLPCLLKLVVCPLAMWGACLALGVSHDLIRVGILQASMPTSVICSILCAQYAMDGAAAGGVVFVGTGLALASIPLLQALFR